MRGRRGVPLSEITRFLEAKAPSSCAESWDNVGLLVGDPEARVRGAIVSVDLTEEALALADKKDHRLVLNHHAAIFPKGRGPSRITAGHPIYRAIRDGIAIHACHTNFDRCALEVPEAVARKLGAQAVGRLAYKPEESLLKLAVYVPDTHLDRVRDAIAAAGAGHIGRYDSCSFSHSGVGTFRGGAGTDPFLGRPGKLERVQETKLETVVPRGMEGEVLSALRSAHPYEEIAFDLFPLVQSPPSSGLAKGLGYGVVAELPRAIALAEFLRRVKSAFGLSKVRVTGAGKAGKATIGTVGFVAGKGSDFIGRAKAQGCDAFVTGEVDYHDALAAARSGMTLVELGHPESERFFLLTMAAWMKELGLPTTVLGPKLQKIV